MSYTPPTGGSIPFAFDGVYTPPVGGSVNFSFGDHTLGTLLPGGVAPGGFGTATLALHTQGLFPSGTPSLLAFGSATVWNYDRFVLTSGLSPGAIGTAVIQNFVRYLQPSGFTGAVGTASVINTLADQLVFPSGAAPGVFGSVNVSPRILRPFGIGPAGTGVPLVQPNPSPLGFETVAWGVPVIDYRTVIVKPNGVPAFDVGLPDIRDRTKHISGASIIESAIFGDIAIRNTRRLLPVEGFDSGFVSPFASLLNKNRQLSPYGIAPDLTSSLDGASYTWRYNDTATAYVPFDSTTGSTTDLNAGAVVSGAEFGTLQVVEGPLSDVATVAIFTGDVETSRIVLTLTASANIDLYEDGVLVYTLSYSAVYPPASVAHGPRLWAVTGGFVLVYQGQIWVYKRATSVFSQLNFGTYATTDADSGVLLTALTGTVKSFDSDNPGASAAWTQTIEAGNTAVATDGAHIFASGTGISGDSYLHTINPSTGALIASLVLTGVAELVAIGGYVFVRTGDDLSKYDSSLSLITSIKVFGAGVGIRIVNGLLTVGDRSRASSGALTDTLYVVDPVTLKTIHKPGFNSRGSEVWNYAPNITPIGFDASLLGDSHETGIGFRDRVVSGFGWRADGYGTPVLTKTPAIAPAGIPVSGFGAVMVALRIRSIQAQGTQNDALGIATLWDRVRYVRDVGQQDLSLYGTPSITHFSRFLTEVKVGDASTFGTQITWFRVRALSPAGIGQLFVGQQFGAAKVADARQLLDINGLGVPSGLFGNLVIARNERALSPAGFIGAAGTPTVDWKRRYLVVPGIEFSEYGSTVVHNNTQITEVVTPANYSTYGTALVENRNRLIRTYGVDTAKLPTGVTVFNKARVLSPIGFGETWGLPFIAARVRYLNEVGSDGLLMSANAIVYNATRRLEPNGVGRGQAGVPRVWDNTQHVDTADGGVDTSKWGTPFIAYRVRALDADRFGALPPPWPDPYIGLFSRYVTPVSIEGDAGTPTVEIHFSIINTHGADMSLYGTTAVRNKTPQLYAGSMEAPANPQKPYIGFRVRSVLAQGFDASLYGRQYVGPRTRYVMPGSWSSLIMSRLNDVRFDAPQIPAAQTVFVGPDNLFSAYGQSRAELRGFHVTGFESIRWGIHSVRSNVLFPSSVVMADADQVGTPTCNGPQYIDLDDGGVEPLDVPKPFLGPYYLRISENFYGALVLQEALMDYPNVKRPIFGSSVVSNKNRRFFHSSTDDHFYQSGNALVAYRVRRVTPTGIAPLRFGFPFVPNSGDIRPYWGRDISEDLPGVSYDTAEYGEPIVSYAPTAYDPNIRPVGQDVTLWGAADVSNFIRVVRASGTYDQPFGDTWIHPPVRIFPVGFSESWGLPYTDFKIRHLFPRGFEASGWSYDAGSFEFGTLRVRHRFNTRTSGIAPLIIPPPRIELADLACIATLGDTSAYGRPRIGACAC